jgi:tetratricopeptide (TPR) repeat protein
LALVLIAAFLAPPRQTAAGPNDLALGERKLNERRFGEAEGAFRKALADDPDSAKAHSGLALALLAQGKSAEAVAEAARAVALAPGDPEALFRYGLALSGDGKLDQAADAFEKVVRAQPDKSAPRLALAMARAAEGDERAIPAFEEAARLSPEDPSVRARFAAFLWQIGKNAEGNSRMEEALLLAPQEPSLHAAYGRALYLQEKYTDAIAELQRADALGGANVQVLYLLGNAEWEAGKTGDAVATFEKAVSADPSRVGPAYDLGRLLVWLGRPDEAIPRLEKAASLDPSSAPIRVDLGRAEEAAGRPEEGEAAYRKAIALDPDASGAHFALGRLLVRSGRRAEGQRELAEYRKAYDAEQKRKFDENSRRAELDLAWVVLRKGQAAEALLRFEKLPEGAESLEGAAAALSALGRHGEAIADLERARALAPDDTRIPALLAKEYEQTGAGK